MKFNTYRYIPKKETKNAAFLAGMFIFATAALWVISVFIHRFKIIYELSGVVTAMAAVQVTTRFIISGYIYILDKTDFIVVRADGKKSARVCDINLDAAIGISEKNKKFADIKKQFGKIKVRMNFCQNLFSDKSYSYIFEFNGKKTLIKFECDENFIAEMKKRIEYAKSGDKDDDDFDEYGYG